MSLNILPPVTIFEYKLRPYRCESCGFEKEIKTNHTVSCFDTCVCSADWKLGPRIKIPALGNHTYRRFNYIGDED